MNDSLDESDSFKHSTRSATNKSERYVTARGTEEGFVVRIDGRAPWELVINEIRDFLDSRRHFLNGGQVALEWLDRMPSKEQSLELEAIFEVEFGLTIARKKSSRLRLQSNQLSSNSKNEGANSLDPALKEPDLKTLESSSLEQINSASSNKRAVNSRAVNSVEKSFQDKVASETLLEKLEVSKRGLKQSLKGLLYNKERLINMIGGEDDSLMEFDRHYVKDIADALGEDIINDLEPNSRLIFGTVRSGQRIETPYSLIVIGDVNPGSDLVAGGDIIVLGNLRGTAHACAYDDDFQDRVIIALVMRPVQLRIGSIISRGGDDKARGIEIAKIEDRRIVVESFNPKNINRRRK